MLNRAKILGFLLYILSKKALLEVLTLPGVSLRLEHVMAIENKQYAQVCMFINMHVIRFYKTIKLALILITEDIKTIPFSPDPAYKLEWREGLTGLE